MNRSCGRASGCTLVSSPSPAHRREQEQEEQEQEQHFIVADRLRAIETSLGDASVFRVADVAQPSHASLFEEAEHGRGARARSSLQETPSTCRKGLPRIAVRIQIPEVHCRHGLLTETTAGEMQRAEETAIHHLHRSELKPSTFFFFFFFFLVRAGLL